MNTASESRIGVMNIMDRSGHKQLTWSTDRLDEIVEAKETFDALMKKGYSAFGANQKEEAKHLIKEFDPTVEEMVLVPKIVGG